MCRGSNLTIPHLWCGVKLLRSVGSTLRNRDVPGKERDRGNVMGPVRVYAGGGGGRVGNPIPPPPKKTIRCPLCYYDFWPK